MKGRILWVEGERVNNPSFLSALQNRAYDLKIVPSGAIALSRLPEIDPDLVVINVPSLRSNCKRIVQSIRDTNGALPIVVILPPEKPEISAKRLYRTNGAEFDPTASPKHRRNPLQAAEYEHANVVLTLPFTLRKLVNRIVPLLPGGGEHMLHVGPLRLDLERKRVRCLGREARLTPRLAKLLQILMQHPGEVMQRDDLFKQVWETKYAGDTRTLDVHISWLRQAIEEDARHPQLLKTVRGVGYRLDI